jgi:hypothetical protein
MSDAILLRFAQEELVYLLRALSIATLPGMDSKPLGDLDADHQALALAVADRTLRARGSVKWDSQEERHVDPIVAGTLRDCAQPRYSLLIDIVRTDRVDLRYLYAFTRHAAIEHCIPKPGIHQFVVVAAPNEVTAHINTMLAIDETLQSSGEAGRISQQRLEAARAGASTDVEEAARLLASELAGEAANGLAAALNAPQVVEHLALWPGMPSESDNREPGSTLTIVQGSTNLYLLWKEKPGASDVEVIPATSAEARQYVEKLLSPALEVLPGLKS